MIIEQLESSVCRYNHQSSHGKMHILPQTPQITVLQPLPKRCWLTRSKLTNQLILIVTCFSLLWLQVQPICALFLQQPIQSSANINIINNNNNQQQQQQQTGANGVSSQMSDLANSGAIMQALSQFAAQQVSGGTGGFIQSPQGLQVTANSLPSGAISINNQPAILVNGNGGNNQTAYIASTTQGQQQQQQANGGNQFVIKWIHNDPKNQMAYVSITPVNYTNLHEPRIELRYQSKYPFVSLAESSPNNTVVAAVIVNDEDTGPNGETSLAIEQGNELGHFKLVSTSFTNTIQVNGAPLSRHLKPEYNLTIVARDHGSPPKASSSTLVIKLHASPMQAGSTLSASQSAYSHSQQQAQYNPNSPLEPQPSLKPPVTDLMYVGTMLVVMFSAVIILIIIGCALVQRPSQKGDKTHKSPAPPRSTSNSNSRIVPPTDQCSAYCLTSGYDLSNLNH